MNTLGLFWTKELAKVSCRSSEEPDEVDKLTLDEIEVKSYVGGIVKSFERKAA